MAEKRNTNLKIRALGIKDKKALTALTQTTPLLQRHFGWIPPLDWLGQQPFLALFKKEKLLAALACPPDPPHVAWIRLFACAPDFCPKKAWHLLWPTAQKRLKEKNAQIVATIVFEDWFQKPLLESHFTPKHHVDILTRNIGHAALPNIQSITSVRTMKTKDIPAVQTLDETAFAPLWQNSREKLQHALKIAAIATVAEANKKIVGYQISTGDAQEGHLARIAVSPNHQKRGVGSALLHDLLTKFEQQGYEEISVNTQTQNAPSQHLYQKFGFQKTSERYPIYQKDL